MDRAFYRLPWPRLIAEVLQHFIHLFLGDLDGLLFHPNVPEIPKVDQGLQRHHGFEGNRLHLQQL